MTCKLVPPKHQAMSNFFHVIEMKGRLIFESKHSNFRMALSSYLHEPEQEGIQMCITNSKDNSQEDVVVKMSLVSMKQHPQDNITEPTVSPRPKAPIKAEATASDPCFY